MTKKYSVYFTILDEKGYKRPALIHAWYESPIDAIKSVKAKYRTAANIVCTLYRPKER